MSERVAVGMSFSDSAFVLSLIFAPLLAVGAVLAHALDGPPGLAVTLLIVAVPFAVLAVVRYRKIAANRRWLTPTPTGFVLTDPRGEFEFADDMVSDLATWAKPVYANGVAKRHHRTGSFVITAGESAVTFDFAYDFPLGQPDPLGDMIQRIFDRLVAQAKAAVQGGGRLHGKGWSLDRTELLAVVGREEVSVPLREVSAVDITDGKVCVWRKGHAEAIVRVEAGSPNALVIGRVLQDLLPPAQEEDPGDGLGRVIFERDSSIRPAAMIGGGVLALAGFLFGVGLIVAYLRGGTNVGGLVVGLFLMVLIAGSTVGVWRNRVNVFRCHAYGVARTTPRDVQKLRYAEVGSFTYSGVRQYVNGAYTGTTVKLDFLPLDPQRGEPVHYSATFKNADEELDNLREFISRVVAGHMVTRLQAGTPVPWFAGMVFHPGGLELRRAGGWLKGKGELELVDYRRVSDVNVQDGVFRLALDGEKKWAVQEKVGQPNFFPGFVVLMTILHPPREQPAADATPAAGAGDE